MADVVEHYEKLFAALIYKHGRLSPETITSIIGFDAGGPVSLNKVAGTNIYATCELSLYAEQELSAEGMKYELLVSSLDEDAARSLLTMLGNLSFNACLGHGHTIDMSGMDSPWDAVRLSLFSRSNISGQLHGIYEVLPISAHGA